MGKFWEDFKAFAFKGNLIDMAVGVIIGSAFSAVVTSLVNDIIMPLIGKATAGIDLKELKWIISEAVTAEDGTVATAEIAINYGAFIQNILYLLLVAISIFIFVRIIRRGLSEAKEGVVKIAEKKRKGKEVQPEPEPEPEPTAPQPPTEAELLTEIRDLLKNQNSSNNNDKTT